VDMPGCGRIPVPSELGSLHQTSKIVRLGPFG
jgi:hypothetical protein